MKNRKLILRSVILIIVLAMFVVSFAACTKTEEPADTKDSKVETNDKPVEKEEPKPEPVTIKLWRSIDRFLPEERESLIPYADQYGKLEEMFNCKFEFTDVPKESQDDQLNIMITTNDLPDIIHSWSSMDKTIIDPALLYANGQTWALDELQEFLPNYYATLDKYPAIKKSVTNPDGKIIAFRVPNIYLESAFTGGPMIRLDWVEKLGMKMPETYTDWLDYFEGVKTNDMNGNGDTTDEVPYVGSSGTLRVLGNTMGTPDDFFMKGGPNGTVVYGPSLPEYRERLEFMSTIAQKGYINETFLNYDGALRDSLMSNDAAGATFTGIGNMDRWNLQQAEAGHPTFLMWAVPYPKGPDGKAYFDRGSITKSTTDDTYTIAKTSESPETCAKLMDYFYSEEGILLNSFGVEGVTYNMVDGFPVFSDVIVKNEEGLSAFDARMKFVSLAGVPSPVEIRDVAQLSLKTPASRMAVMHIWTDVFDINTNTPIPPALMEDADAQEFADIMGDLKTYVDESTVKFLKGEWNLDDDFDAFQATVKDMDYERALELMQKAVKQWQTAGGDYEYNMERANINWSVLPMSSDRGSEHADDDVLS